MKSKEYFFPLENSNFLNFQEGFYNVEKDDYYFFRWMKKEGKVKLIFDTSKRDFFFQFSCFSNFLDLSQNLKVKFNGQEVLNTKLVHQWQILTFKIPHFEKEGIIEFETNKIFPKIYYPEDERELSIRLANFKVHFDEEKFLKIKGLEENSIKNIEEMAEGKTVLSSFPQYLGIDISEKCNIKPPCVYCLWEDAKILENPEKGEIFDPNTLISYKDFYLNAKKLINCSIGEPLINPYLKNIIDLMEEDEKILELATNGHLMEDKLIEIFENKKVILYISLDAAKKETYAKLRNDNFDKICENLKKFKSIKKEGSLWPKIYTVFMPMKVNLKDLEDFFVLSKELGAEQIIFRPLNKIDKYKKPLVRGGYKFVYNDEILNLKENMDFWEKALKLKDKYKIPIVNQLFFGMEEKQGAVKEIPKDSKLDNIFIPLCKEPWESYYILKRGIWPCCYGYGPIAKTISFENGWNSKEIVEIRNALKEGRFSDYCLKSISCPIVQRHKKEEKRSINFF